jgi:hypothetical protein
MTGGALLERRSDERLPRRPQPHQPPAHAGAEPRREPGDAPRHRADARRPRQGPGRHRGRPLRRQPLQHAPRRPRHAGAGLGPGGRSRGDALLHRRRLRRHQHGHGRHELFPSVAGAHRGLRRDRDGGALLRRPHRPPRLRQEHAGGVHGDGPPEPSGADDLRRHHPPRRPGEPRRRQGVPRRDQRLPELRRGPRRPHHGGGAAGHRGPRVPWTRRLRRHVHREHDGGGHRDPRAGPPRLLVDAGRGPGQGGGVRRRRGGDAAAPGAGSQAAGHPDAHQLQERDGRHHRPRRLDERGPPPAGDGPDRRGTPRPRRLPGGQRSHPAPGRPEAFGPLRDGGPPRRRRHPPRSSRCCSTRASSRATR